MATAFFIAPYKRDLSFPGPARYCAMDDFTPLIRTDGGDWAEAEIVGNRAIVKVRASDATLNTIASEPTFARLPDIAAAMAQWSPRRKPRYDPATNQIILDGPFQWTRSIASINSAVS